MRTTKLPTLVILAVLSTATPAAAAQATITKGPWLQRVTSHSAIVRVEVDPPAPVTVAIDPLPVHDARDVDAGHVDAGDVDTGHVDAGDVDAGQLDAKHVDAGDVDEAGAAEARGPRRIVSEARALHAINVAGLEAATRYSYSVAVNDAPAKRGTFTTAPREDSRAPFRFLVYGDNRNDEAAHAAVIRAMVGAESDFVLHTGDFVQRGESPDQWQTFFDIEAPLLGARCIFSCVGNHELTDGSGIAYARFFGPAELPDAPIATRPEHLAGTFRWSNARFFLVNGMVSFSVGSDNRALLEQQLAAADAEPGLDWRIVTIHHGPFSSGPHGGNARLHDANIPALLKAHKIDLVISGHDHIYERGWGGGLAYVVSGGGGAPVYKVKAPIAEASKVEAVRHFVQISVSPSSLQLVATRADGSTIERCSLGRNATRWDCDPEKTPAPPAPKSRCSCESPGTRSAGTTVLALALGALAIATHRRRRR